jgi:DNA-binding LacI/PurR family transcriptional regulator
VLCVISDFAVSQATEEFKVVLSEVLADAGYSCVYLHHSGARRPLEDLWQHVHPAVVVSFGELSQPDAEAVRRAGAELIEAILGADSSHLIGIDQAELGRMQVRYLAAQGHHRLGFAAVAEPREARFCLPRQHGAQGACVELGLPAPVVAVLDDTPDTAGAALAQWRDNGATAVAAYNDLTALAVIDACRAAHLTVPDDLAVIGVDDLKLASLVTPRLTTIAMDLTVPAHLLAQRVLELVPATPRTKTTRQQHRQVFRLIKRESA